MIDDAERYTCDIADCAKFLGVSERSIRRLIKLGLLPALRVRLTGGVGRPRILVRRRDLVAFVESSEPVTTTRDAARAIVARVMAGRR